jgi:hypothetical protein
VRALRRLGLTLAAAALLGLAPAPVPVYGFTVAAAARERAAEARFLDLPSAQGALDHAAVIGAHPHYAGTPADRALAAYAAYAATAWSDPGFVLHRTMAQLYGVLAMRLAGADALPYAFGSYVAALRDGLAQVETRARDEGRSIDLVAVRSSIDAFAAAARRADEAIARGEGPGADRELAAAQSIDKLAYGVNGYASVAFPEVTKAYASGSAGAVSAALAGARAAIDDATKNLL